MFSHSFTGGLIQASVGIVPAVGILFLKRSGFLLNAFAITMSLFSNTF